MQRKHEEMYDRKVFKPWRFNWIPCAEIKDCYLTEKDDKTPSQHKLARGYITCQFNQIQIPIFSKILLHVHPLLGNVLVNEFRQILDEQYVARLRMNGRGCVLCLPR
jgi:hypothetical protein